MNHLKNINRIALAVPHVLIWMPTREVDTLRRFLKEVGLFADNLRPRVPAPGVDSKPLKGWKYTSTVVSDAEKASCIAQLQMNRCDGEVGNTTARIFPHSMIGSP